MNDLNRARQRMDQAVDSGVAFDVVCADLGCEAEMLHIMARYTAVSFLETLLEEFDIDYDRPEINIEQSDYCGDLSIDWMNGFLIALLLTPDDRREISFSAFLQSMLAARRLGRTLPELLCSLDLDARDATEAATTVGEMTAPSSDVIVPNLAFKEWAGIHARTWLDGLIVARLARTTPEHEHASDTAAS
ncbi:MAG: hypothetical protein ACRDK4_11175 [Solirubrobacteraceae bacterium]